MKFHSGRRRDDPRVDLTPLIDCMFMVVLFLLVSTTFTNNPGIQVSLPRASSQQTVLSDKTDLNIWMALDGQIFLDEQPIGMDGLKAKFQAIAKHDPGTLVVIKADTGVAHGKVVGVMDLARNEGLSRLAIATEVEKGATP